MLQHLKLDAGEDTPFVDFDAETGLLQINGRALPEDAHAFFSPLQNWLENYSSAPAKQTVIDLKIDYFNSAATRYIFNILMDLENLAGSGNDVKVVWHFKKDDEMIAAKGEELQSMLDLTFDMRPF